MKKIISILLIIVFLFSTLVFSAYAENTPVAKVKEYLVAPSQYTNNEAFGIHIEKTLSQGGPISLGNFGGYVIYEFTDPIINSDYHKYGVDFTISGNAFNAAYTTQEPGQVWVSQNGINWFALAGSEHYEEETEWDYSVTYSTNEEKKITFVDSNDDTGSVSPASYPLQSNYSSVNIPENNLTLSGILLRKERVPSPKNGISTSFGYVDTLKNGNTFDAYNPYLENPANNCHDGQFDISWAVDENGIGVNLDWIKYVKVQTATFIDGAIYGEKSTEISSVGLVFDDDYYPETNGVTSIQIGDKTIYPDKNKNYYEVDVNSSFDVIVSTENDSNIYINNSYGSNKHFDQKPEKGIIRVIVQRENQQPLIYYINTGKSTSPDDITISDTEKNLYIGETYKLTANSKSGKNILWSSSDNSIVSVDNNGNVTALRNGTAYILASDENGIGKSCKITVENSVPPVEFPINFRILNDDNSISECSLTVKSNISEKYGYEVAKKDHNGNPINNPTVFDTLVTMHEKIYGSSFNKYTKDNYLIIESGFVIKAFGESAASSGFFVNNVMPNDGIINSAYNSYTGYSADTAQLNKNDKVLYYFYRDKRNFSDIYSWFNSNEYAVAPKEKITVNVSGYSVMENGLNDWETILNNYAFPLRDIEIYTYIDGEKIYLDTTNRKGNAEIKFSNSGEYTIYADGNVKNSDGSLSPVMTAIATVKVDDSYKPSREGFIGWIITVWHKIINFFKNLF